MFIFRESTGRFSLGNAGLEVIGTPDSLVSGDSRCLQMRWDEQCEMKERVGRQVCGGRLRRG